VGDGTIEIFSAATLDDATGSDITLVDKQEKSDRLAKAAARAVVAPRDFPLHAASLPTILVDDVHRAFATIVAHFRPPRPCPRVGVSPSAMIHRSARLGHDVDVHAGASIDADVEIGAGSTIHSGARVMAGCKLGQSVTIFPNAVLYENTVIGDRSVVHAGSVLGAHGFGYRFQDGGHLPMAQLGWVRVGSDCEIGANSTIDRGTYGPTVIGDGTKIDNLVMIAHNCQIGKHNIICSQVGIAGSTVTGDFVILAGQVGIRDHVRIGEGAVLGAKAGVSNDVPAGARMFGVPATNERDQKQLLATLPRLPEMRRQLKALTRKLERMEAEQAAKTERPQSPGQQAA
ncbi:MAG: UDP-3-O-(3-hydroxymyristoyl)glucosamine N-acyltransferase, partial [Pirellulales bacterium]